MKELELIKQQELLIAKTKENQSGGSSGEENENRHRAESLIHQTETSMNDEKAKNIPPEQKEN